MNLPVMLSGLRLVAAEDKTEKRQRGVNDEEIITNGNTCSKHDDGGV